MYIISTTYVGAVYIGELLRVTSSLEVLDVSRNDIGDNGISVILKELHFNNTLSKLTMENCRLSMRGIFILILAILYGCMFSFCTGGRIILAIVASACFILCIPRLKFHIKIP